RNGCDRAGSRRRGCRVPWTPACSPTGRGGVARRRPATPGRTGPQDRATLEGLAQASVPRPLPLAGLRGHAAPPRAPDACLVVLGRNNPSLYTVKGRPLYVHLNGLAIVLLK